MIDRFAPSEITHRTRQQNVQAIDMGDNHWLVKKEDGTEVVMNSEAFHRAYEQVTLYGGYGLEDYEKIFIATIDELSINPPIGTPVWIKLIDESLSGFGKIAGYQDTLEVIGNDYVLIKNYHVIVELENGHTYYHKHTPFYWEYDEKLLEIRRKKLEQT